MREKPIEIPSEESPLDTLEHTSRLARFRDSSLRFFKEMTRNLGSLLTPPGEASQGGTSGGGSGLGSGGLSGLLKGKPSQSLRPELRYSHSNPKIDEPWNSDTMKKLLTDETLQRLFHGLFPDESLKESLFTPLALSPLNLISELPASFKVKEPFSKNLQNRSRLSLENLPAKITDPIDPASLKKPLLYAGSKKLDPASLKELKPYQGPNPSFSNFLPETDTFFKLPDESPTDFSNPAVIASEAKQSQKGNGPIPFSTSEAPLPGNLGEGGEPSQSPRVNPSQNPPSLPNPASSPREESNRSSEGKAPRFSYTPLVWDALASRKHADERDEGEKKENKKLRHPNLRRERGSSNAGVESTQEKHLFEPNANQYLAHLIGLLKLPLSLPPAFSLSERWQDLLSVLSGQGLTRNEAQVAVGALMRWIHDASKDGSVFRMTDAMEFDWDRLYVFAPYTTNQQVSEEIGFKWMGLASEDERNEDLCFLIFVKQNKVIQFFKYQRLYGDFSQAYQRGGYSSQEAVFTARKGSELLHGEFPPLLIPVNES